MDMSVWMEADAAVRKQSSITEVIPRIAANVGIDVQKETTVSVVSARHAPRTLAQRIAMQNISIYSMMPPTAASAEMPVHQVACVIMGHVRQAPYTAKVYITARHIAMDRTWI